MLTYKMMLLQWSGAQCPCCGHRRPSMFEVKKARQAGGILSDNELKRIKEIGKVGVTIEDEQLEMLDRTAQYLAKLPIKERNLILDKIKAEIGL